MEGVERDDADHVVGLKLLHELLGRPARGHDLPSEPLRHAPGLVDDEDDAEPHRLLPLVRDARPHRHGQQLLHRRPAVAAGAEAVGPAEHHEPPAVLLHVPFEQLHPRLPERSARDPREDDAVVGEKPLERVRDDLRPPDLRLDILRLEHLGEEVSPLAGAADAEDPRPVDDEDRRADRLGHPGPPLDERGERRRDPVRPRLGDGVRELEGVRARLERDGPLLDELLPGAQLERPVRRRLPAVLGDDPHHEPLGDGDLLREVEAHEREARLPRAGRRREAVDPHAVPSRLDGRRDGVPGVFVAVAEDQETSRAGGRKGETGRLDRGGDIGRIGEDIRGEGAGGDVAGEPLRHLAPAREQDNPLRRRRVREGEQLPRAPLRPFPPLRAHAVGDIHRRDDGGGAHLLRPAAKAREEEDAEDERRGAGEEGGEQPQRPPAPQGECPHHPECEHHA